ncbi:hypothetical protein ACQP2P_28330 [Dactylosporangium sp. CA-139114]|uniref:hypothetical protein n=1 Tax=Dactylosporangium sp. CA-139114 TaxID=3239931 RepID=UPI003D996262
MAGSAADTKPQTSGSPAGAARPSQYPSNRRTLVMVEHCHAHLMPSIAFFRAISV